MRKTRLLTIAVLALSTIAATALAVDGKNYPGILCVPWTGATNNYWSVLKNNASVHAYVDCPIIKDNVEANWIEPSWIRVIDQHPTMPVECTFFSLMSVTATSASATMYGPVASGGAAASQKILSFPYNIAADAAYGNIYFSCSIPPVASGAWSGIATYNVTEP